MLSAEEIRTVQEDWQKVVPIAPTAASLFYDRLFELDPRLRNLFPPDLTEQKKKLLAMLGTAVGSLSNLPAIVSAVQDLGRRHAVRCRALALRHGGRGAAVDPEGPWRRVRRRPRGGLDQGLRGALRHDAGRGGRSAQGRLVP